MRPLFVKLDSKFCGTAKIPSRLVPDPETPTDHLRIEEQIPERERQCAHHDKGESVSPGDQACHAPGRRQHHQPGQRNDQRHMAQLWSQPAGIVVTSKRDTCTRANRFDCPAHTCDGKPNG